MEKLRYDENCPITKQYTVLTEKTEGNIKYKLCTDCGYQTYSNWHKDSKDLVEIEKSMSSSCRDSKYTDAHGLVWYPLPFQHFKYALLPIVNEDTNFQLFWRTANVRPIEHKDDIQTHQTMLNPIILEDGSEKLQVLKIENESIQMYSIDKFADAFDDYMELCGNAAIVLENDSQ